MTWYDFALAVYVTVAFLIYCRFRYFLENDLYHLESKGIQIPPGKRLELHFMCTWEAVRWPWGIWIDGISSLVEKLKYEDPYTKSDADPVDEYRDEDAGQPEEPWGAL